MAGAGGITVAVDDVDLPLSTTDAARIAAVDDRIVLVRRSTAASAEGWAATRREADALLERDAARFGTQEVPAPADPDAAARAEFAVAALFAFAKGLSPAGAAADRTAAMADLRDQMLLVIGLGATGREVVRLGDALGMRVLAMNRSGRTDIPAIDTIRTTVFLGDLLPVSHAVVLALPETEHTSGVIGAGALASMRSDAVLVNIGSGAALDADALADALRSERIAGAALDGRAAADLAPDSPLLARPNVLTGPHDPARSAGVTHRLVEAFLAGLHRHLRDETPA